ncbi:phage portal protein [Amycolatopsis thermoflava]|uniref:phage portal protein n=1 Tax=Amycolatopsis thermoflava TaxID=84480 RepID=UPI0004142BE3|nr:phage portal protein [Amycolatopsis thermoflava]
MGWLRTLLRWSEAPGSPSAPEPSVTFSHDLPTPVDTLVSGASKFSNTPVTRALALSVPAVLRGRNLLCSIATLPLVTRDKDRMLVRSSLLEQIDPNVANVVTLAQTVEDLVFDAISWWQITDRLADGFPRSAVHVDVNTVSLNPPPGARQLRTLPSGQQLPGGVVWVNGQPVPGQDMIRFDSPNPPLLGAAARAIRRAILFDRASSMYASDPRPQDYFTPAENADPIEDDEVEEILDDWEAARRERATAYVPAALKYQTVNAPTPAELQLVELKKEATIEIANALGLDAEDLQVSTTSRTYANATDRRRDRINDVLAMYMRAVTDRLSMNDVTRRGQKVEFNLDDYLKANATERWNTYQTGLTTRVLTVPEVREMEGLPAIPVEVSPRQQQTPAADQGQPQTTEEAGMTRTATSAQFAEDSNHDVIAFAIPVADANFRVDVEKRTVSGLLVPWNKVARSGWAKYRFSKDSLSWSDTSRVKLNLDHNRSEAIGYAVKLESTDKGLEGTFKIARGEDGDKALMKADDKVLDGFSIEAEFNEDGSSWGADPNDDMVRLVSDARLAGVALTAFPAFDDARVSGVKASRKDSRMTDKPDGPQGQQGTAVAGPDAATTAAFTAAVEAFTKNTGTLAEAISTLVEVQQNGSEGPAFVDPTRPKARFSVNEEALYRFDGSRGKHDFSTDIISGAKGDHEALKRAEQWIQENFAFPGGADFAVNQAGVKALNPDINRPDLYVDQLEYPTPIWDAIRKGTIDDNTPFVLPKFQSASNLVNNHTEGTEPTPGAFSTTTQTITPSAVSGKVEVTREAWDQGGNPQLSTILWRQMVREYNEALEEASAALLESLTVTTVTLTAGAVDTALAQEVKEALAALHFSRGGFRFRDFKLEQGLYTALAAAKDADGRPLFPVLGATNADGTMGQFFGSLAIGGLAGVPAWALPFVDGAANDSYLFNREDVHGWASNPQRLDFQYRVAFVDVAVWGYKALACTRTDGVRKITYDNAAV